MHKLRIIIILFLCAVLLLMMTSGNFLVVSDVQHADVIVVLAGETNQRPSLGVRLLSENYASRMLLDAPAEEVVFDHKTLDLAQSYVDNLPQRQSISICPIVGLSTKAEAHDVLGCLAHSGAHRILVVTSDYHTRRARSTLAHEMKGYEIFIAGSQDQQQFGASWWQHRQWAKINWDEWIRLVWWEIFDRWH